MFKSEEIYEVMLQETKGTSVHQPLAFLTKDPTRLLAIEDGYPFPAKVTKEVSE